MHAEVEVKVLEIDVDDMIARLEATGAKKVFDDVMTATYFKGPVDVLRVRQEGDEVFLQVKDRVSKKQVRLSTELSVKVDRAASAIALCEALGYPVKRSYSKRRVSYVIDDIRYDIDIYRGDVSFVPPFLEVESGAVDKVKKGLRLIGLTLEDSVSLTGGDLVRKYRPSS